MTKLDEIIKKIEPTIYQPIGMTSREFGIELTKQVAIEFAKHIEKELPTWDDVFKAIEMANPGIFTDDILNIIEQLKSKK